MAKWIDADIIKSEIEMRMYFNEFHIKEYKKLEKPSKYETEEYREECAQHLAYASLLPFIDDNTFTGEELKQIENI